LTGHIISGGKRDQSRENELRFKEYIERPMTKEYLKKKNESLELLTQKHISMDYEQNKI
jgi:hypothetical protein